MLNCFSSICKSEMYKNKIKKNYRVYLELSCCKVLKLHMKVM